MDGRGNRRKRDNAHGWRPATRTHYAVTVLGVAFCLCGTVMPVLAEELPPLDMKTGVHETMQESLPEPPPKKASTVTEVKVEQKQPRNVSLHVKDAPVKDILQGLAELTGTNVIFSGDVHGTVTASLDHVTAEEAMKLVLSSTGLLSHKDGSTLVVFGRGEDKQKGKGVSSFRLSYASAKEVANALKGPFEEKNISYNASANTVLMAGTPQELLEADRLVRDMDVPEKQVKVEAEVIAVNKSSAKDLGIDWDFKSITGSAEYSRDDWHEQRYITNENGEPDLDDSGYPRVRYIEHSGWKAEAPEGYAGISYGRSVEGHPYTFFFQAKLNALVTEGKARVLAKPNVVTMNGRQAEILIGSRIPVIVEHMENGVKTTATEYKDAGIKLTYTPIISGQDEITADVHAEVSTPYLVPEMKAYRIITRSANTMVRLQSGDIMTIGGLIDKEEGKTFRKVPILGDIPILGKLFQSHGRTSEESEIVIIIRADIIGDES